MQRAVAAHRDAADSPRARVRKGAVLAVNGGHEVLNKKILISLAAVIGVYIKGPASGIRKHHQKGADSPLLQRRVQDGLAAVFIPCAVVLKEAVEEIKDRVKAASGTVVCGQVHTVVHPARQNPACERRANQPRRHQPYRCGSWLAGGGSAPDYAQQKGRPKATNAALRRAPSVGD